MIGLAEAEFGKVLAVNKEHVNANNNMAWALMNQNKTGALGMPSEPENWLQGPCGDGYHAAALAEAGKSNRP